MSTGPANSSAPSSAHAETKFVPQKKRRGCGCLGSLSGVIVVFLFFALLLNPWALRMGGRWTPALTWHGVGKLESTTGASYGLFLEVTLRVGRGASNNLAGTAKLCTPQGEVYPLTVDGYLKHAWLDADGKPVTFYFRTPKGAQPRLTFSLLGSWHGQVLVAADKGTMAMSFAPDGRAKGYLVGANSPKESATATLHYAKEDEFSGACQGKNGNSF